MGHDIDFKTFWSLQGLNKMHNEQVLDVMSESNKNMRFLGLSKCVLIQHKMRDTKVTAILSPASVSTPSILLGQLDSNKAKLEAAWQSSLATHNIGKPLLAPLPMAGSANR